MHFTCNLSRSRMCLILQGTRFQVQVLKSCKSVQETSEKWMFIKIGQIPDSSRHIVFIKV